MCGGFVCDAGIKGFITEGILDTLGQYGSILSGHPTIGVPGIEVNTGALGHGLSVGVGIAIAAKMDNRDYKTYVLMGMVNRVKVPSTKQQWLPGSID